MAAATSSKQQAQRQKQLQGETLTTGSCLSKLRGSHTAAVVVTSFFRLTLFVCECTPAVLLATHEFASIPSAIRPLKGAKSMFCIVFVPTTIPPSIGKDKHALTMHQAVLPLTLILAAICPYEDAMTTTAVADILALIATAYTISTKSKGARTTFGTFSELTNIATTVGKTQCAVAVLFAFRPVTAERRSVCPCPSTVAMRSVIHPLPRIAAAAARLGKCSITFSDSLVKLSSILALIWPGLGTVALRFSGQPLTSVCGPTPTKYPPLNGPW
mmetsp:Transcript_79918/g.158308  ORF Transcript_79918/g.158308 Transcript_79918/m.158308 type:complete len:272 (+) Transcript_79918:189-1004(+)|eukprot:CAMPEP_0172709140 /NCGR_PEP_ID=MMETSP1074-20121228/53512_1 /TAXON_ID=2916 /ORGANISM="Ceratium fusus, Strain PA161109" /LENGTH=271 /DNA_ID=CAMNT_0013532295 /DNA_START=148 /DNA_END=963 /DNA_ORIENTATION=-